MAFGDILKTFKKPSNDNGGILGKMDRYLLSLDGKLMKEMDYERAKDCFHPSELSTNPCTRAIVYRWLKTPPSNYKPIQPRIKRVFDVGHHKGFILQQYFWDMGILEGNYQCMKCDHKWWDTSPKHCPSCDEKLFIWHNMKYLEVPVHNEKWNIIGHSDGIIHIGDQRVLIELKSIKNRDKKTSDHAVCFEDLSQAKIEHVYQTNLYMDALDEQYGKGGNYIDRGLIIYFAKNTQEIKEFPIKKMGMMLEPSYQKIVDVEDALTQEYLPQRAGRMKSDKVCTFCPWKDYCWDKTKDYSFKESDHR